MICCSRSAYANRGKRSTFWWGRAGSLPFSTRLEQIYGEKATTVLPGSAIYCVNERNTGYFTIRHHDDDGQPIQEGRGTFRVQGLTYIRVVGEELEEEEVLAPAEASRLLTLSETELYETHSLFRRVQI